MTVYDLLRTLEESTVVFVRLDGDDYEPYDLRIRMKDSDVRVKEWGLLTQHEIYIETEEVD